MLIRDFNECPEFVAGDKCLLREYLHPDRQTADINYSLALARVAPGGRTLAHRLTTTEVYFILQGRGTMVIDEEHAEVYARQAIYIPKNARQYIMNTGDEELCFLCICDPPWRPDVETVET